MSYLSGYTDSPHVGSGTCVDITWSSLGTPTPRAWQMSCQLKYRYSQGLYCQALYVPIRYVPVHIRESVCTLLVLRLGLLVDSGQHSLLACLYKFQLPTYSINPLVPWQRTGLLLTKHHQISSETPSQIGLI